jgi:ribosomal protein L37AE/L43A
MDKELEKAQALSKNDLLRKLRTGTEIKQRPLLTKLDQHWKDDIGPGWHALLDELHEKLLEVDPDYKIEQVKEKFGGLRYYISTHVGSKAFDIEAEYEARSFHICEECGQEGRLHRRPSHGWIQTVCDACGAAKGMKPCDEEGEI